MSSRNIRRLMEQRERNRKKERLENEEDTEDEDYYGEFSPHFVHMNPVYEGLVEESLSESELSYMSEPLDQLEELDENDLLYETNLHDATVKLKETSLLDETDQANETKQNEQYQDEAAAVIPEEKPTHQLGQHAQTNQPSDLLEQPAQADEPNQEGQYQDEAAAVIPEEDKYGAKKKTYTKSESGNKNKKNKRKNKKNKKNKKPEEMDEIDWSVQEVNRLLGDPPKSVVEVEIDDAALCEKRLFKVHPNQINVNYELAKVFGDEQRLLRARNCTRKMRHEIGLSPDVHPFSVKGLSMTRYKMEGDIKHFKFEHTPDYRVRCQNLVEQLRHNLANQFRHENNLHSENCVEALLENCDFLYYVEEHKGANQALEQAIYFMQSVGEPSFNFVDGKTRLEYEFVENRPFLIAILKYLHVLTNIACHRTALALAKVLLNLDPSDPLAIIFIIDTLALRAREHQWLIDLIEHWREKRQANRLFHMRYSRALAMFHVACKKKDYNGLDAAKLALIKAIKYFPDVAAMIIKFSKFPVSEDLINHEIFVPKANNTQSHDLQELMALYAWLISARWRERKVWTWLIDTVTDVIDSYDRSPEIQEEIRNNAKLRAQLYRKFPTQVKRHLYAIRPMAKYISDGRMPYTKPTVSFNPYPCEASNIDTYNYYANWLQQYSPEEYTFMNILQGIHPELYQVGKRNMGEMLEMMHGKEIKTDFGRYLVVGPNVYQDAEDDGNYCLVFVRYRHQTAYDIDDPDPQNHRFNARPRLANFIPREDIVAPLVNRQEPNGDLDVANGQQNGHPDDIEGVDGIDNVQNGGQVVMNGQQNGNPDDIEGVDGIDNVQNGGQVVMNGQQNGNPDDIEGVDGIDNLQNDGLVVMNGQQNGNPDDIEGVDGVDNVQNGGQVVMNGQQNGHADDIDGIDNLQNGGRVVINGQQNGHADDIDNLQNGGRVVINGQQNGHADDIDGIDNLQNGGRVLMNGQHNGYLDEMEVLQNGNLNVVNGQPNGHLNGYPDNIQGFDRYQNDINVLQNGGVVVMNGQQNLYPNDFDDFYGFDGFDGFDAFDGFDGFNAFDAFEGLDDFGDFGGIDFLHNGGLVVMNGQQHGYLDIEDINFLQNGGLVIINGQINGYHNDINGINVLPNGGLVAMNGQQNEYPEDIEAIDVLANGYYDYLEEPEDPDQPDH